MHSHPVVAFLALGLLGVILACGARPRNGSSGGGGSPEDARFDRETEVFYWAHLDFRPAYGVSLGHHRYDGILPDRSANALRAEIDRLRRARSTYESLAADALSHEHRVEREVILNEIRGELFDLEVLRSPWRNPMTYTAPFELTPYISRDYKPIAERARAILGFCRGARAYFAAARENLEPRIPRPWLETALLQVNGGIDFVRNDVPRAMADLHDAALAAELRTGLEDLRREITAFRDFLQARSAQATNDYALGADTFARLIRDTQGVDVDLPTLKRVAQADLDRNLAALEAAARSIDAHRSVRDVVATVSQDRPAADAILREATAQATEMRQFLIDHAIVSIPSDERAVVEDSPPFMRWNAAFLDPAGVFEPQPLPSFYYISPPDPHWSAEEQREYVMPRADLLFTTIHELWPGHFLHALHMKRSPSRVLKTFWTYSTGEGWAHYAEELMWDEGAGHQDPRIHVGQLLGALLRDVRFLSAIGLHAEGMTVEQSTALFREKAFSDPAGARQQAVRGTFDPLYVSYTLGKLMIKKLREDWRAREGARFTLRAFHDRFLSYGAAPVPVIRREMLGDAAGPPL